MSVSYSPTPAVSFPARRSPIRPAQDAPLATVRDIASAPSVRRRIEAQRADDPAFLRPPAPPRRPEKPSRRGMVAGTVATLALSVGAGILGLTLQPDTYDGPTVIKAAVSGDSVWRKTFAVSVRSKRLSRISNALMTSVVPSIPGSASSCRFDRGEPGTPGTGEGVSVYR